VLSDGAAKNEVCDRSCFGLRLASVFYSVRVLACFLRCSFSSNKSLFSSESSPGRGCRGQPRILDVRRVWPLWQDLLVILKSETIVSWHRACFRPYWSRRSRCSGGRPKVSEEIRNLDCRLAKENPSFGAPRIHGDLPKLGFEVSERSVARYVRSVRRRGDPVTVGWHFC